MADKTTGELTAVTEAAIGDLPGIASLYDDTLLPVEQQGEARHMTGAQWKMYAIYSVEPVAELASQAANRAASSAQNAIIAKDGAEKARQAIENMSVSAKTLSPGNNATVTKTSVSGVVLLSFGIPKGEKGDTGNRGPKGDSGVQGPAGAQGDVGPTGPEGPKGETGPQGERGPRGETGPQGERGPKGDKGDPGQRGEQGPQGINGVAVSASGTYAFNVDENGHLIVHYTGTAAPDFSISDSGHLILNI